MRLTYFTCTLALLTACGPDTGNTDTTGSTTNATSGASTGTTGTTGTTTEPTSTTSTTGDPVTDGSAGSTLITATSTSDTSTSDPTTGTTGTTTTTGTTGDTGTPAEACLVDADCALHSDCCTCEGVPFDRDVASCDERCKQTQCSAIGVDAAVCRLGVCETERVSCDQSKVTCDQLPPPCPDGQLAETDGVCYTGDCVPARFCDVVPDCADCPDDMMCVQKVAFMVESITCEPIPPGCGGVVDCDCVGELVCTDNFQGCFEQGGAVVNCECLNC